MANRVCTGIPGTGKFPGNSSFFGTGIPGKNVWEFREIWEIFLLVSNVLKTFLERLKSDAKPNFSLNSYVCDGVVVYTNVLLPNIDFQLFIINESI